MSSFKPRAPQSRLRNQKGQMTIEAVLLLVIFVGIFLVTQRIFKEKNYLSQIVSGPWSYMRGMVESGVWMDAESARSKHPNRFSRRASPRPN
ncbi:MAG: hypothetical protein K2Q26_01185 [Bdellovibrionales bacterium]|nr:hypothetical protein [Bdellovibrionales bacterium]